MKKVGVKRKPKKKVGVKKKPQPKSIKYKRTYTA